MNNSHLLGSMQVFISVVDSGSFSESARRLGLSQPSISRKINALEEDLGVRLLQRTTRRLSLTEAGQIYYEKAQNIQREVIEASQSISGFKETPSGVLRISAPHTWTDKKIAPYLGEFLRLYPEIKIDIECNDNIQDIIDDQLDLVIRVGALRDSSYIAVPFGRIRMVLCATPNYLKEHGMPQSPADLRNHNFIMYENYNQLLFHTSAETQQINISGTVSTNTVTIMLSALLQHIGLTALPDLIISDLLETGELIDIMPDSDIKIKNLVVDQAFALYSNRRHLPAKVRVFLDFFRPRFHCSGLVCKDTKLKNLQA